MNNKASIIDINNFKVIKSLGHGASGYVNLVEDVKTHKQYAMKYINIKKKPISVHEIDSYVKIDHPTILKFYGYDSSNPEMLVLLLEYMSNGSLESVLRSKNPPTNFTGTKKYIILLGIAYGMNYLHSQSIIHRDLKTDNILLDENFYPRICDFDISYISDRPCSSVRMDESVGTPLYKSPEILKKQNYSYKIDVYSFALIAYELITGKEPFEGCKNQKELYENVVQGIRPDISNLPYEIQDFLNLCWSNDQIIRPNFVDIINLLNQQSFKQIFQVDEIEYELYFYSFNDLSNITEIVNKININKAIEEGNYDDILLYGEYLYYSIPQIIDKNEALNYIKIAADKGSIDAMYKYACLLDNNKNNRKEIDKYLKMAADNDHIDAMFYYGIRYISEYKMQKFNEERIYYIKKAADLGHKKAVYWYGYFLNEGKRIKVNKKEAAKYLKKSADIFNLDAMHYYGQMLIEGDGITENIKEGIDYIKRAADLGDVEYMYYYAILLFNGEKIPVDKIESCRYFKMAANQGHGEAAYYYSRMIYYGNGVPLNRKEAQKYFKLGGDNGCLISMFYYVLTILVDFDNETKDKEEGFFYLKKLMDSEFTYAITFFWFITVINDMIYLHQDEIGQKCFIDIQMSQEEISLYKQKSLNFFEKECDKGNEYVLFFYIDILSYGLGAQKDPAKVIKYLQKLIAKGNDKAMKMYAIKLLYGFDVNKNIYEAYNLFKMASYKGNKIAKYFMNGMLNDKEIFKKLFDAGYADLNDLYKSENNDDFGCFNYTNDFIRKKIVSEDCDNALDFFGQGVILSYPEYKHNSEKTNNLSELKIASKSGDIDSRYLYGKALLNDSQSFESKTSSVKYIKEAADEGHIEASFKLGEILYNGNSTKVNKREAAKYFKFAADKGEKQAMFYYGKMLYEGHDISKDSKKEFLYLQKSADFGCIDALSFIGQLIYQNKIPDTNKADSVKYFQKAAELDDPVSLFYYGNMLLQGEFVEKDIEKGIKYIKKSADLGNADASLKYGIILLDDAEVPENKDQAMFYVKKAADQGNEKALLKYSQILIKDEKNLPNIKEAAVYLKMLADQGNEEAMYELGKLKRVSSEINDLSTKTSVEYFKESADLGNANSMCEYAKILFDKKRRNKEDLIKAAEYYKMSADLGNPEAMFAYGNMLYNGICIPCNKKESLEYLKKSAELKYPYGMLTYAQILRETRDIT